MALGHDCCCECTNTLTTVNIPGAQGPQGEPGEDGEDAVISPAEGNPEGNVIGIPGQTYLNTTDDSFWIKKSGLDEYGWIQLIAGAACLLFILFLFGFAANAQPIVRTYYTTNTTPVVAASITNTALVSMTNNYSYISNAVAMISLTNPTVRASITNAAYMVVTNSATTNMVINIATNTTAAMGAVTNPAASTLSTNRILSTVTNSFPLATNGLGLSCVLYVVDESALTNQLWFTNGILYITNRF